MIKFAGPDVVNYVIQAVKNLLQGYVKKEDVIDNLDTTDTEKPLAANQGRILNEKFDEKWSDMQKSFYIGPGESITLRCRDNRPAGNLIILSSFMSIPTYKTVAIVMSGNGNNTNSGQSVTITNLLENSLVKYEKMNVPNQYNDILITNSGEYGVYIRAVTLFGTSPTLVTE